MGDVGLRKAISPVCVGAAMFSDWIYLARLRQDDSKRRAAISIFS